MVSCRAQAHTLPAGVQRPHVKHVGSLHLAEDFETLETGGLLDIGGHGTGLGTAGGEEILFAREFCVLRFWSAIENNHEARISEPSLAAVGG